MDNPAANPVNWPATSIETRKIGELKPYDKNSRTHKPEQIKQIAKSMRQWGWTMPILIDEDNVILAGHARTLAAKRLGFKDAPVLVARGWTEAQKRAYVIADNKLTENGGWDKELLAGEIAALNDMSFDLDLIGFTDAQLTRLLGDTDELDAEAKLGGMKFSIVIECDDEEQQTLFLSTLEREGIPCRALIS